MFCSFVLSKSWNKEKREEYVLRKRFTWQNIIICSILIFIFLLPHDQCGCRIIVSFTANTLDYKSDSPEFNCVSPRESVPVPPTEFIFEDIIYSYSLTLSKLGRKGWPGRPGWWSPGCGRSNTSRSCRRCSAAGPSQPSQQQSAGRSDSPSHSLNTRINCFWFQRRS